MNIQINTFSEYLQMLYTPKYVHLKLNVNKPCSIKKVIKWFHKHKNKNPTRFIKSYRTKNIKTNRTVILVNLET